MVTSRSSSTTGIPKAPNKEQIPIATNTNMFCYDSDDSFEQWMKQEDEDWEELCILATQRQIRQGRMREAAETSSDEEMEEGKVDHRTLPRKKRKDYNHGRALECIMADYLGPQPLFNDRQFELHYRVSRARFQRLMEDFGNSGRSFYKNKAGVTGVSVPSFETRLLLPLKTIALWSVTPLSPGLLPGIIPICQGLY